MRISDWSSDVCSSDLQHLQSSDVVARRGFGIGDEATVMQFLRRGVRPLAEIEEAAHQAGSAGCGAGPNRRTTTPAHADPIDPASPPSRSAARRVGKEWVRTCGSRWAPDHEKKN